MGPELGPGLHLCVRGIRQGDDKEVLEISDSGQEP